MTTLKSEALLWVSSSAWLRLACHLECTDHRHWLFCCWDLSMCTNYRLSRQSTAGSRSHVACHVDNTVPHFTCKLLSAVSLMQRSCDRCSVVIVAATASPLQPGLNSAAAAAAGPLCRVCWHFWCPGYYDTHQCGTGTGGYVTLCYVCVT
jgi:hypothetical protein